jgi:hypothetical protein
MAFLPRIFVFVSFDLFINNNTNVIKKKKKKKKEEEKKDIIT